MFESMENELNPSKKSKNKDKIKNKMHDAIPQIYNALYPSVTSLAVETRMKLEETKNDLELWIKNNSEIVEQQRSMFQSFLDKFQNINKRITQIS